MFLVEEARNRIAHRVIAKLNTLSRYIEIGYGGIAKRLNLT